MRNKSQKELLNALYYGFNLNQPLPSWLVFWLFLYLAFSSSGLNCVSDLLWLGLWLGP